MVFRGLLAALAAILAIALASPAHAQATRTWVSGVGDDANPCSRTAPCKTFAGAIAKTATAGEISCLDPGGFGGVTITKTITINCRGTHGSVLQSSGANGIVVNGAGVVATIRHIAFIGSGTAGAAIRVVNGTAVVDDADITGFDTGIDVAAGGTAIVSNAAIASSRKAAVIAAGAGARVFIGQSRLTANAVGLQSSAGGSITSLGANVFAANGSDGAFTATSAPR